MGTEHQETVTKPLKIYVAGPYTPKECSLHDASRLAQKNVDTAAKIGNALMAKGHFVFVPHLTHYLHIHESCEVKDSNFWYDLDDTFLYDWADSLFYISPSWGADRERKIAEDELWLEVFTKLEQVPKVIQPCYASCGHTKDNFCEIGWSSYNVCKHKETVVQVISKQEGKQ